MLSLGPGSVTHWISHLKAGDGAAADVLWRRYYGGLIRLARNVLRRAPRGPADEEDVALTAFHCLCRGAASDRFPRLEDRRDLWRLLGSITAQKAVDQLRREARKKRGGRRAVDGSLWHALAPDEGADLSALEDHKPTPEDAALLAEGLERLLERLGDGTLRQVALLKMEGYTIDDISERLELGKRTVERKLGLIRAIWKSKEPV
jgi:DNA-directed RNA polymerase specialized sigma24 family protein